MDTVKTDVSVTAVHCLLNSLGTVVAGIGNRVEIYESGLLQNSVTVFGPTSASIHGFIESKCSSKILVFGAKEVEILNLPNFKTIENSKVSCEDWIFTAKWISSSAILLLTAHNRILKLEISEAGLKLLPEVVSCEEKCILYSGQIVEDANEDCEASVLAGTVFRELVIWSVPKEPNSAENVVIHRLEGHEGVIFSVKFSAENSMICTTSDDRTARLWKVDSPNPRIFPWRDSKIVCLHVLADFHSSRIFSSIFYAGSIVSVGEDSAFCRWSVSSGAKINWKRPAHEGSPIWSADIDTEKGVLYTGGGDAALKSWPLEASSIAKSTLLDYPKTDTDYARHVFYFNDVLLCLTTSGKVLNIHTDKTRIVFEDTDLASYAVVDILAEDKIVFATIDGKIKIWFGHFENGELKCRLLVSQNIHDGKILSLASLTDNEVLTCGQSGEMKLIVFDGEEITVLRKFVLPESKEQRWFSCACIVESSILAVGDRCGNLHFFGFPVNNDNCRFDQPIKSFFKLHGRFGIGSIENLGAMLTTVGRDGVLQKFEIDRTFAENFAQTEWIRKAGSTRLKFTWLEKLLQFSGKSFVLGFHSDKFVVFNLTDQTVACEMSCGGSHRSWTYRQGEDSFVFTFIRDRAIEQFSVPLSSILGTKALRPPLHSLEINAIEKFDFAGQTFLMTGSEDTTLKIFGVNDNFRCVTQIATLTTHISSVKCIEVVEDKQFILAVSAGGRAQVKVWKISESLENQLSIVESASHLLKGNDKMRKKTWRDKELIRDAETRYMDVICLERDHPNFAIVLACSDAVVRKFIYNSFTEKLQLVSESNPPDSHAFLCISKPKAANGYDFFTSSTEGKVIFWNLDNLTKVKEVSVHGSGVNSLRCLPGIGIVTGGDDGALGLLLKSKIELKTGANSGHITGIIALDETRFITCSADQRVSIWRIHNEKFQLEYQKFSHVPDLKDIIVCKSKLSRDVYVAVVGAGMQFFKLI